MGGMAVLEWPLCSPPGYIRHIVPLATAARHSAWCISWGEAQRQSIYSDPAYLDGYYDPVDGQPKVGLAAARMAALLTYRSRDSFESRFGRKTQMRLRNAEAGGLSASSSSTATRSPRPNAILTPPDSPSTPADHALAQHNDGHRGSQTPTASSRRQSASHLSPSSFDPSYSSSAPTPTPSTPIPPPAIFSAQSYLRYQGDKFTSRFDANCYIHISRKMDTHDLSRGRYPLTTSSEDPLTLTPEEQLDALHSTLAQLPRGALVISIQTDGLFTPSEQHEIASYIPDAYLVTIPSPDGHDGFLLEFEAINKHILAFLHERLPEIYEAEPVAPEEEVGAGAGFEVTKTSTFGEAEADITQW